MISVIVPVYNVANYLRRCVDSIVKQTYDELEIILVDDGSTDDSSAICDEYAVKDNRIRVIHKQNGGLSDARNTGLDMAQGEWIAFVDSDDYIDKRMYEVLFNNVCKTGADISTCDFLYISEKDTPTKQVEDEVLEEYEGDEVIKRLWLDNVRTVIQWDKIFKRDLFEELRYPVGRYHEDTFVIHRELAKCKKIVYTNQKLYYYVQRDNSIMSVPNQKRVEDVAAAYEDRIQFFSELGKVEALQQSKRMVLDELMYMADGQIRNKNWSIVRYINQIYRQYFMRYHRFVAGKKYWYLFLHYKLYQRYSRL